MPVSDSPFPFSDFCSSLESDTTSVSGRYAESNAEVYQVSVDGVCEHPSQGIRTAVHLHLLSIASSEILVPPNSVCFSRGGGTCVRFFDFRKEQLDAERTTQALCPLESAHSRDTYKTGKQTKSLILRN
jgi:hypothetical protein